MTPYLVFALVLLVGASGLSVPERIVGGQEARIEDYPSIVQVESRGIWSGVWGQSCAANILTSYYVLSAAHCFDGATYAAENRRIRAGTTQRNLGGQMVPVVREFNHPDWGTLGYDADISVVLMQDPLIYSPVIARGVIIAQGYVMSDNTPVIHAGWGHTTFGGTASDVLRDVTIYTINTELCRQRYLELQRPGIVTDNMICAGVLDVGGKDACQGDSGGPLYFKDATGQLIIVGIVSWGHGCANETYPGISTAVSSYTNWIVKTTS